MRLPNGHEKLKERRDSTSIAFSGSKWAGKAEENQLNTELKQNSPICCYKWETRILTLHCLACCCFWGDFRKIGKKKEAGMAAGLQFKGLGILQVRLWNWRRRKWWLGTSFWARRLAHNNSGINVQKAPAATVGSFKSLCTAVKNQMFKEVNSWWNVFSEHF